MIKTNYKIARIIISVESICGLNDNEGYSLYRIAERDDGGASASARYEIRLVEDSDFPAMEGRVLFQNEMNLYLEKDGGILHFFRIPLTRWVAAWCETTEERSLTIHFKPAARAYFGGAIGCFNAAAMEYVLYVFRRFLFHCSYVDVEGEAVLFSAHSGGGKTTHGLLWEKCGMGEMINGDRAVIEKVDVSKSGDGEVIERADVSERRDGGAVEEALMGGERMSGGGFMVHGLPIAGSSNVFKNRSLPLRAIFMLEKAPVNEVVEIPAPRQFMQVFEQMTVHTWDREFVGAAADFVTELIGSVPVRLLRCRPDEGAVQAVREALGRK